MRCKKHVTDLSSAVGVCASCLRDRLFIVIAAQEKAQEAAVAARQQEQQHRASFAAATQDDRRKSEAIQPPVAFPRSVSPYISRRKSDSCSYAASWDDPRHHQKKNHHHQDSFPDERLFYSTPQVGPNGALVAAGSSAKKKGRFRFSLFGIFFRSKPDHMDSDPPFSGSGQAIDSLDSCTISAPSPAWFSSIFRGRRKKQIRTFSLDESSVASGQRRVCRHPDRGMSPARYSDDEDEHYNYESSGYSSESSQQWKQTPRRTPASLPPGKRYGGNGRHGHGLNISGVSFCLSPWVRPSPSRQWNKKGGVPPEMVAPGDIRVVPVKPLMSKAGPFCKNRSRKLADFGRFHQNR